MFTFYFYLILTAVIVILIFLIIWIRSLRTHGLISRSLNLELFLVRFPKNPGEELNREQIRERISLMEQFYASLGLIRDKWWRTVLYGGPVFALELAIPSVGEELTFYIAVPKRVASSVEKIIQGIFPDAYVEPSRDYNIFNPEGEAVGSFLLMSRNNFYPARTYQRLEGDPLKEITGVFTKLARENEGAALQIVARPADRKWNKLLRGKAKELYGENKRESVAREIFKELIGIGKEAGKPQQEEKQFKRLTPIEEEEVKLFEAKASKLLFEANVRLLASASTRERASAILKELEAGFSQFSDPNLNGFRTTAATKDRLKELIFNFSFRNFDKKRKIILSTEELASIFHFPNVPLGTPGIKLMKAREAPPPLNLPGEGLLLGYNSFRGIRREIKIMDDDRRRHLYIIGQTGTGKTAFLKNLIQQDIENGKGVCFIDPHGDAAEEILGMIPRERWQDVIYFNPGDDEKAIGLNMLEYDPARPTEKTLVVNELIGIFHKLYGAVPESMGPAFEQYFRNAAMLVMEDPSSGNTLIEIVRVFADREFRQLKLSRSQNITVNQFWTKIAEQTVGEQSLQNFAQYVTSKFDIFLSNEIMRPIVSQQKSAFNFREIMDNQKILIVNLTKGRLGDINSSLLGLIVVGKLLIAALARGEIHEEEKRKDFYLYLDEFQNVTTDSIATILSEARKYRLNLIVAHQFIGQLREEIKKAIFGNVGSMVAFRIGSDDAEFMAKQFKPQFNEEDLLHIDNFNCYVKLLINNETSPPFNMKTYPPEKGSREVAQIVKEISRAKYGRLREEVEEEIRKRYL